MLREYSAIPVNSMPAGARLAQNRPSARVAIDAPAIEVMTDLEAVAAASITPDRPLDEANAIMIRRGVRLLFVVDGAGTIAGVITATDLLGEKPVRFAQDHGVKRGEVLVGDIMTPASGMDTLSMQDVGHSRVGHVVATLKALGRQHALVADLGTKRIRGIFSASHVARRLGVDLQTSEIAHTFAEIEAALAH
jgi:CBS domain-containing protein